MPHPAAAGMGHTRHPIKRSCIALGFFFLNSEVLCFRLLRGNQKGRGGPSPSHHGAAVDCREHSSPRQALQAPQNATGLHPIRKAWQASNGLTGINLPPGVRLACHFLGHRSRLLNTPDFHPRLSGRNAAGSRLLISSLLGVAKQCFDQIAHHSTLRVHWYRITASRPPVG